MGRRGVGSTLSEGSFVTYVSFGGQKERLDCKSLVIILKTTFFGKVVTNLFICHFLTSGFELFAVTQQFHNTACESMVPQQNLTCETFQTLWLMEE